MDPDERVVYNRADCPYGCGEPLAPRLRWQATPCRRCGRLQYPLREVVALADGSLDADGDIRVLWPPASVPRPPDADQPGVDVWYVVGEEEAQEAAAIRNEETGSRVLASEESCLRTCGLLALGLIIVVVVAAVALYFLVIAPR
jgi:hypothetical protein